MPHSKYNPVNPVRRVQIEEKIIHDACTHNLPTTHFLRSHLGLVNKFNLIHLKKVSLVLVEAGCAGILSNLSVSQAMTLLTLSCSAGHKCGF